MVGRTGRQEDHMPNPVLNESKFIGGADTAPGWGSVGTAPPAAPGRGVPTAPPPPDGTTRVGGPFAPATAGPTMTVGGTATATAVLFVLLLASGVYGWSQVEQVPVIDEATREVIGSNTTLPGWIFLVLIGAVVVGLVTSFVPKIARFTAPIYALGSGIALGAISALYEIAYNGIVLQAVGATLATFAVMLGLFVTRVIKVTQKLRMVVMGATLGIFVLYMVSWIASIFGANFYFWNEPSPLGIGISVLICGVAAFNLLLDFDFIERMTGRAPKYMEWYGAFGLTVTIVWLYLEILRLLSLLRQN
jgi:uncharacterized YccA/Bax inhibitor family protein